MVIEPGAAVPDFLLRREDGSEFTAADLDGRRTVLVFYPFAFSPVCTDQLNLYEEVLDELKLRVSDNREGIDQTFTFEAAKRSNCRGPRAINLRNAKDSDFVGKSTKQFS